MKTEIEPAFVWRKEWADFLAEIISVPEAVNFVRTIAEYGLFGRDINVLCGEELEYFNTVVRPDLDEQRNKKGV